MQVSNSVVNSGVDAVVPGQKAATMGAIAQSEYGSTEVLHYVEVDRPTPKANEVLIQVKATSINAGDWHLMRGTPFLIRLMFGGILRPSISILGMDVAGIVAAVGAEVTEFQVGDEVFGEVAGCGFGGFAEYVCVTENALIHKPQSLSFEDAAVVPEAAITAFQALRHCGEIQAGQKVLINGASGGVGSFAVQIAQALGAEVTGIYHPEKMDMGRSLGLTHLIDYTKTDVTEMGEHYDLIIDAAAYRPFQDYLPILKPEGIYVVIGGATVSFFKVMLFGAWATRKTKKQVKCLSMTMNKNDLVTITDLLMAGKIKPIIDRRFSLAEVPEAIRYLENRQVQGKIAIKI